MAKQFTKQIVTATLTLQVSVDLVDEHPVALKSQLNSLVEYALNRGLITGETSLEVSDVGWNVVISKPVTAVD